eukprot:187021-Amphidinium_carterae.1
MNPSATSGPPHVVHEWRAPRKAHASMSTLRTLARTKNSVPFQHVLQLPEPWGSQHTLREQQVRTMAWLQGSSPEHCDVFESGRLHKLVKAECETSIAIVTEVVRWRFPVHLPDLPSPFCRSR